MKQIILALVLLFVIVSCQPQIKCVSPNVIIGSECCLDQNKNGVCDRSDKPSAPPINLTPVSQTQPIKEDVASPSVVEVVPQVSNATKKWEAKIAQKVKSYQYVGQVKSQFNAQFYVKYPKVRVDFTNAIPVNVLEGTDNVVNHLYFDMEEKTALGVCEAGFTLCKSRKGESYAIDFEEWRPTLPPELFKKVENYPLELEQPSAEIQQDRRLTLLRYVKGGENHNLYVDEFFGMPLRYVIEKGGAKSIVEYKSIAFNTLQDYDFKLPIMA